MLIHIGNGYLVRDRDVVGFFDIDGSVTPAITAEFLKSAERRGQCASAVLDLPRCFVLEVPEGSGGDLRGRGRGKKDELVILSHLSSSALAKRADAAKRPPLPDAPRP